MTTITTNINLALERLKQGDVVAIPTETVYGLAADATNDELRYADQSEADVIVIELPSNEIKWRAIREKILKAGQRINSI